MKKKKGEREHKGKEPYPQLQPVIYQKQQDELERRHSPNLESHD